MHDEMRSELIIGTMVVRYDRKQEYLKCSRLYNKTNQQILIRLKLPSTLTMCQHNLSVLF